MAKRQRKTSQGPVEKIALLHAAAEQFNRERFPINVRLETSSDQNAVFVSFSVRTTSWDFSGERTDLNDFWSTLIAVFIRLFSNASCSLHDVSHPVPVPETEIYARYIIIDQPFESWIRVTDDGLDQLNRLFAAVRYFHLLLPHMVDIVPGTTQDSSPEFEGPVITWASHVAAVLGEQSDSEKVQFNARLHPKWMYYRSIRQHISVLHAPTTSFVLHSLTNETDAWKIHQGINGALYLSDDVNSFVSSRTSAKLARLLEGLNGHAAAEKVAIIPLENYIVAISGHYTVFMKEDCSRRRFGEERDRIYRRHQKETRELFPLKSIKWRDHIDDDQFEDLVLALLKREPGVRWIRRVSGSRERDGGRDLICEWQTGPVPGETITDDEPLTVIRRVLVQCKALRKTVGKAEVPDILDTITFHDADGYFLAVASRISTTLTDHLEKLRNTRKYYVDWWSRTELEDRLLKHPDIVSRYPGVVTAEFWFIGKVSRTGNSSGFADSG